MIMNKEEALTMAGTKKEALCRAPLNFWKSFLEKGKKYNNQPMREQGWEVTAGTSILQ